LAGTLLFDEKIRQSTALFFGLDCGMLKFFTLKPQSKEQLMSLPNYWSTVRRRIYKQAGGLEAFLHEAAQKLFQIFSTEI
jgi:hypothetical protein